MDDCSIFDGDGAIPGFEYIGEVSFVDSGTWQVEFSGENNVDVMIRDDDSFGGFLGILGGGGVCCFGILFLLIGGILAATMKDKPKVGISPIVPVETEDVVVVHDSSSQSDGEWWEESDIGKKS